MTNEIITILLGIIGTVLTALVTWGTQRLIIWLNGKIKNDKMAGHIDCALNIVASTVKQTYQTFVESIKGTEAWTEEAQAKALSDAVTKAQSLLSDEVKNCIADNFGDIAAWLENEIEAKIHDSKKI